MLSKLSSWDKNVGCRNQSDAAAWTSHEPLRCWFRHDEAEQETLIICAALNQLLTRKIQDVSVVNNKNLFIFLIYNTFRQIWSGPVGCFVLDVLRSVPLSIQILCLCFFFTSADKLTTTPLKPLKCWEMEDDCKSYTVRAFKVIYFFCNVCGF